MSIDHVRTRRGYDPADLPIQPDDCGLYARCKFILDLLPFARIFARCRDLFKLSLLVEAAEFGNRRIGQQLL